MVGVMEKGDRLKVSQKKPLLELLFVKKKNKKLFFQIIINLEKMEVHPEELYKDVLPHSHSTAFEIRNGKLLTSTP